MRQETTSRPDPPSSRAGKGIAADHRRPGKGRFRDCEGDAKAMKEGHVFMSRKRAENRIRERRARPGKRGG